MTPRDNTNIAIAAYVIPFALYVAPSLFESVDGVGTTYMAICTLKGVLAAAAFWVYRNHYPAFTARGFPLGIAAGVFGVVIWVVLARLQSILPTIPLLNSLLQIGNRVGFDPYSNGEPSAIQIGFVCVRLAELTIIVPLVEEIFWRGFLARFLIDDDFVNVRQGRFTIFSFFVVTIAFASVHPEFIAAIAWCTMINFLYKRTENLWSCVAMHAVTNAVLGGFILATGNWSLW